MNLLACLAGCLMSTVSYAQYSVHTLKNNNQPIPGIGFAELKNKTVFLADDKVHGMELWETDGQNTKMVADINPNGDGLGSLTFYPLIFNLNNKTYFAAEDGQHGMELWEYDGTNPPKMVADIAAGSNSSNPEYFSSVNNKLYFIGNYKDVFCYDPANGSTSNLTNYTVNTFAEKLTALNGKLVFAAYIDVQVDKELYVLDPQSNSINLVANINAAPTASSNPKSLIVANNKLYFFALENSTGYELYEYDGTNTPVKLTDINPGAANSVLNITIPNLCAYKGKLYFGVETSASTSELYSYDPATKIVTAVTQFNNRNVNGELMVYGRRLYFGTRSTSASYEMYVYDGANPAQPISAYGVQNLEAFESMGVSNGRLFFGGVLAPAHEGHSFMFVDSMALDVPEVTISDIVKVYPNPATSEADISFTLKQPAKLHVQLTDMEGKVVQTIEAKQYRSGQQEIKIPVQTLVAGNYIYSVISDGGEILGRGKLVKE